VRRPRPERIPTYLEDMLNAIDRIEGYIVDMDKQAFLQSQLFQDAILKNFETLGEASNRIIVSDPDFEEHHPDIQLHRAYGMRNALIHGYDEVNLDVVWTAIQDYLPPLKAAIVLLQNQGQ
jgi:uncharacterized protein with HEPN domain